jgi:putative transposase
LVTRASPELSVRRQCVLLGISRGGIYYKPRGMNVTNAMLMRRIDELYTAHPFLGYRKLAALLRVDGHAVNNKRVLRLMRRMGLQAVYCKPNTSKPHPEHRVYPYLLKRVAVVHPNQVWAADITYIRLARGWCYLVAIIDWYSRYVMAWRLSATMESGFCVDALEEALTHGTPDIHNTDQGTQFTSQAFIDVLTTNGIAISMDGRGSYQDNIFTERLWRSVKYEEVYLKEYVTLEQAQAALTEYFCFYNERRPHQALAYQTPEQVHFALARPRPMDMMDNCARRLRNGNALRAQLPTSPQANHNHQW